jgi:gas vesicle protein
MDNTGKILAAAGAGLAIGAALGILFAPAKGEDTRKAIKDKTSDLAANAKDKMESVDLSGMLQNMKDRVQTEYKESKENTKESLIAKIEALEAIIKKA